jgi:hypothetical protein
MFLTETDQSVLLASQAIPPGNVVEAISSTDAHSGVVSVQDGSYAIPLLDELIPLFKVVG